MKTLETFTAQMVELRQRAPLRYALYGIITTIGLLMLLVPIGVLTGALFGAVLGLGLALYTLFAFSAAILAALIPSDDIDAALGRVQLLADMDRQ